MASGNDIRKWRQRFRIASGVLAEQMGVSEAHICRVENGTLKLTDPIWQRFQHATMQFALREKRFEMCEPNMMADVYILADLGAGHLAKLMETKNVPTDSKRNPVRDRR